MIAYLLLTVLGAIIITDPEDTTARLAGWTAFLGGAFLLGLAL
jgi:hypothetical protein